MSADNGVYILQTPIQQHVGPPRPHTGYSEYRVAHLQAIDNLYWDNKTKRFTNDPKILIKNVRRMFRKAPLFYNVEEALDAAKRLHGEVGWSEYGIVLIEIPEVF